ncbi:hypothetical protein GF312_08135 [Candidatus Poribacteria bacterium]|nr:hypothetical protein [Candidatus Poribacteria bacterium]
MQERQVGERLENLLDELLNILDMEMNQYKELLSLLYKQREYFKSGDIKGFEGNTKQQGTIVLRIKTIEEARKYIVQTIAQHFNIPTNEFTLSKLSKLVESPYDAQYTSYRKDITKILRELGNVRERNSYLVQHALHHVNGVLKTFASSRSSENGYSNKGKIENEIEKGKFVSGWC